MSQILKAKTVQESIELLNFDSPVSLEFQAEGENLISSADGKKHCVGCLNCQNPKCVNITSDEINSSKFKDISQDMNRLVCPVDAIQIGKRSIKINEEKCIGCGLCAVRCPVGAIAIKNGHACLQKGDGISSISVAVTEKNIKKHNDQIKALCLMNCSGTVCIENDKRIETICKKISKMSQEEQNILARNILIALGNKATLTRKGNVYTRMDGFIDTGKYFGVVEVETGADMLDVSRAILDDVAVTNVRYGIEKKDNHPLAIVLGLPNKRTDYWQVLKDIKNVIEIKIGTITFGALLILMWNLSLIDDFDRFYIDVDNSSIRKEIEKIIGRKVKISIGTEGTLENSK